MWSWGQALGWGRVVGGPNMNFTFLVLRAAPDGRTGHVDVDDDDIEKNAYYAISVDFCCCLGPSFCTAGGLSFRWRVGWMLLEYYLIVHTAPSAPNR